MVIFLAASAELNANFMPWKPSVRCSVVIAQDSSLPFSDGQLPTGMRSGDCAGRSHLLQKLCKRQFELAALVMINMPWGSKQLYPVNHEFAGDVV